MALPKKYDWKELREFSISMGGPGAHLGRNPGVQASRDKARRLRRYVSKELGKPKQSIRGAAKRSMGHRAMTLYDPGRGAQKVTANRVLITPPGQAGLPGGSQKLLGPGKGSGALSKINPGDSPIVKLTGKKLDKFKALSAVDIGAAILYALSESARKVVQTDKDIAMKDKALDAQMRMADPEMMYYRAAAPQAQAREQAAASAVMGRLAAGGVMGPALAKGEITIGG
jgi:hypothetical protein